MTCCCPDCYSNFYHEECCCECCKTELICCYCEKNCTKKGLFTIAWSAETPCSSLKPCGIELEFCDTPSNIEQKCEELMGWLGRPPIDDLCECKLKVNEFSCPSTVEALSYSCSCHTASDFKTEESVTESECCCIESENADSVKKDQETNVPSRPNLQKTKESGTDTDKPYNFGAKLRKTKTHDSLGKTDKEVVDEIKGVLNSITNKALESQNIGIEVQVEGKDKGRPLVCSDINEALLKKIIEATNDLLNAQLLFKSPEAEVNKILNEKKACIKICFSDHNPNTENVSKSKPITVLMLAPTPTAIDMKFSQAQGQVMKELHEKLAARGKVEDTPKPIVKVGPNKYELDEEFTILLTCPCSKKPNTSKILLSIEKQADQVAYKVTDFQVLRTSMLDMTKFKDNNASREGGDTEVESEQFLLSKLLDEDEKVTEDNNKPEKLDENSEKPKNQTNEVPPSTTEKQEDNHQLKRHHSRMSPKELKKKLQQAQHKRQEEIEKVKHQLEEVDRATL